MTFRNGLAMLVVVACSAFAVWTIVKARNAPSNEQALQRSLAALEVPELHILYALHPDACSIVKVSTWRWSAECAGVPQHFYRETLHCETSPPDPGARCRPAGAALKEDCVSFFWDVDLDGNPFDSITHRRRNYSSMSSECRPKGTIGSEQEEMARRGMRQVRVEIHGGIITRER